MTGDSDCQVGTVLPVNGWCEFSQTEYLSGDASGPDHNNTFTATATDNEGNTATASDDATVGFDDVQPVAHLTKTPIVVVVTFEVIVYNDSTSTDPMTIDSLIDDIYGDLDKDSEDPLWLTSNCDAGGTIVPGGSYTCSFTAVVSTSPQTDIVTAQVYDDENNPHSPWDWAYVEFGDPPGEGQRSLQQIYYY